jgi:hypothetical protein
LMLMADIEAGVPLRLTCKHACHMLKIRGVIVQVKTCCHFTSMTKATYCNIGNVKSTLADAIDSGRKIVWF